MEQSSQLETVQALEDEEQPIQGQASENSVHTQVQHIVTDLTPKSLDSILYHVQQTQHINDILSQCTYCKYLGQVSPT